MRATDPPIMRSGDPLNSSAVWGKNVSEALPFRAVMPKARKNNPAARLKRIPKAIFLSP